MTEAGPETMTQWGLRTVWVRNHGNLAEEKRRHAGDVQMFGSREEAERARDMRREVQSDKGSWELVARTVTFGAWEEAKPSVAVATTPAAPKVVWHIIRRDGTIACGASYAGLHSTVPGGTQNVNCPNCIALDDDGRWDDDGGRQ